VARNILRKIAVPVGLIASAVVAVLAAVTAIPVAIGIRNQRVFSWVRLVIALTLLVIGTIGIVLIVTLTTSTGTAIRILGAIAITGVVLFVTAALIRAMTIRPRDRKLVNYGLLASPGVMVVTSLIVVFLVRETTLSPTAQPAPEQPIDFPHELHVKSLGLDCTFCHRTATTEASAGMPALQQCMFCHQVVQPATNTEIQKLVTAWNAGKPVDWARVYQLPDHVVFVHEAHLNAGVTCATCHGDVASMTQIRQVRDLRMGDCIACHMKMNAPTECATCHR
jgi:hypothetical protein